MENEVDAEQLADLVGSEVGVSDWREIPQHRIDEFAQVTGDHQYIHVDPERAAGSPFGTTIAHGLLLLSLIPPLAAEALTFRVRGVTTRVNYGFNRVRFTAPVEVDSLIRARFELRDAIEKGTGRWLLTYGVTVEKREGDRPALLAEWLSMLIVDPAEGT